ncbi:MAG: hypothetical protein WCG01_01860 [bacterium]
MATEKVVNNSENQSIDGRIMKVDESQSFERRPDLPSQAIERSDNSQDEGVSNKEVKSSGSRLPLPVPPSLASSEQEKKIENILARDVVELYKGLKDADKLKFKKEGETTAKKISSLLDEGKVQVSKIFNLIKNWLSMLSGVNKYFIEQEAKIKVDEIIQLKKGGEQ